jgi:hypothetical protein
VTLGDLLARAAPSWRSMGSASCPSTSLAVRSPASSTTRGGRAGCGVRRCARPARRRRAVRAQALERGAVAVVADRARNCTSSASPARTARRRRRTCWRDLRGGRASAAGASARSGYRVGAREREAARTTPEAPDLQRMLREMVDAGCGACVMEVSSHALALRRVDYLRFAAGLHEPHARPPRLPRRHGGVLRGQAPAVRDAARRRAGGRQRRRSRGGGLTARPPPRPVTYAIDRPADVRPGALALSLDGLAFDVARRAAARDRVAARRPAERLQHPRRRRDGDGARPAARAIERGHRAALAACPGASRSSRARATTSRGRRLRAHRRRAEEPARDGARAGARPRVDHRVRLRRRPRPHQAAADGRRGGAAERPGRS